MKKMADVIRLAIDPKFNTTDGGVLCCNFRVALTQYGAKKNNVWYKSYCAFGRVAKMIQDEKWGKGDTIEATDFYGRPSEYTAKTGTVIKNTEYVITSGTRIKQCSAVDRSIPEEGSVEESVEE